MATLTNPITPQNIVDRFADFALATANSGITWGTNSKPFSEMSTNCFAGTTSGRSISATGSNIGTAGGTITAATIVSALRTETATYTNIRNLNAKLNVTGGGGNTGSRPTAGIVYNCTRVGHLRTGFRQTLAATANAGVASGSVVTSANLESFFGNLRTAYNTARASTATIQVNVCHASCHSSCHGSRGRR